MAGERILVIDDDPDVREVPPLILEPAGYRLGRERLPGLHGKD